MHPDQVSSADGGFALSAQSEELLNSICHGVLVFDDSALLRFANSYACKKLRIDLKDPKPISFSDLVGQRYDDTPETCPFSFAVDVKETVHVRDETFFRTDGSEITVEFIIEPGINGGAIISFGDISEEFDIKNALFEARETALQNARTKAMLLAKMSHEIRNPLHGIIGMTNILLSTDLNTEQQNYGKLIQTSADLLLEIVNDILDLSKFEFGQPQLESNPFNVRALIHETVRLFSGNAAQKKIELRFAVGAKVPEILNGDSFRIRQILNNFVSNALKFTETGHISVNAVLVSEFEGKASVRFEVSDSGIGISEAAQQNVFEPFAQGDLSGTIRASGTGLGLAICKEIVEQMGGKIGFESESGVGSTFWFSHNFPIGTQDQLIDHRNSLPRNLGFNINASKRAERILVVDDSPVSGEVTLALLRDAGFEPYLAVNGKEAVTICNQRQFDVIFMDLQMPEMDGIEAARIIRSEGKLNSDVRIIAVSGNETDAKIVNDQNFFGYLSKPASRNDLVAAVDGKLRQQSSEKSEDDLDDLSPEGVANFLGISLSTEAKFVNELKEVFFTNTSRLLKESKASLTKRELSALVRISHTLKGSCASIGAKNLSEKFARMEESAKKGKFGNIAKELESATRLFNSTKERFADGSML